MNDNEKQVFVALSGWSPDENYWVNPDVTTRYQTALIRHSLAQAYRHCLGECTCELIK